MPAWLGLPGASKQARQDKLAFSMVYAGAQGESEMQMARALHFLTQDQQHLALNAVDQRM
jgi:hypothetical protein